MKASGVQYNYLGVVIGPAQWGKSTIARQRIEEFVAAHPTGIVLAHDPHGSLGDGFTTWAASVADIRAELAQLGVRPVHRCYSTGGSYVELRGLAVELGRRWNNRNSSRPGAADDVRLPILLVVDESSLMDGKTSATYVDDADRDLASNRRHYGVGFIINAQTVTGINVMWFEQAADVYLFQLGREDAAREAEKRLSLPRGRLTALQTSAKFDHVHWRRGDGLVKS